MMPKLPELLEHGFTHWKLDGIYCPGHNFVEIAKIFVQAKKLVEAGELTQAKAFLLDESIRQWHPKGRSLGTGFYDFDPSEVK